MYYWTLSVAKCGELPVREATEYLLSAKLPIDPTNEQMLEILRRAGWPTDRKIQVTLSEPWSAEDVVDFNARLAIPASDASIAEARARWAAMWHEIDAPKGRELTPTPALAVPG